MAFSATELETRRGESRAGMGIALTIICPAIALLTVVLRIYVRRFLFRILHSEDYAIIGAMTSSIVLTACLAISFSNGAGRHIETVSPDELMRQLKLTPIVVTAYLTTHMLIKLSILLQYVRLSVMRFERALCYSLIAVSTIGWFVSLILNYVLCVPLHALWIPNTPGAKCLNITAVWLSSLIFNMAMDFAILIVPAFILRHLTVPWTQRLLLGIVLAFGGLACIASALRLQTIYATTNSKDKTWDSVPSGIFGTVELNLGITCASVVSLRPLIRQLRRLFPGGGPDEQARVDPRPMDPLRTRILPDEITSFGSTQVASVSGGVELSTVNKELSRTRSATSSNGRTLKGTEDQDPEIAVLVAPLPNMLDFADLVITAQESKQSNSQNVNGKSPLGPPEAPERWSLTP